MGLLSARFLADELETGADYAVSVWRLEAGQPGVGAHHHEGNDELFYVLSGQVEFLTGETLTICGAGSFLRIPRGVTHDFRHAGTGQAEVLNVFLPGGFEREMPEIVKWFAESAG